MKILFIGDIIGSFGCNFLRENLVKIKKKYNIDVVIANGENSAKDNGITPVSAENIYLSGVDVITTGNHIFKKKKNIWDYLKNNKRLLRPANFPNETTPGNGFLKFSFKEIKFCVINLLGVVTLEPLNNPFEEIDIILKKCEDCLIKIIDFHAEATSEKRAFGFYVDGKVSAVFGTHTHVQTNDAQILPKGTGYVTDVGMTGAIDSVLGVKKEISIKKMKERLPIKFEHEENGECKMDCSIADIDEKTGLTNEIKVFSFVKDF